MSGSNTPQTIPRKGIAEPSYAVHRSSSNTDPDPDEAGPSNAAAYHEERPITPPPYSGPTTPSMIIPDPQPPSEIAVAGIPKLDYRLYSPQGFTLSHDKVILSSNDPRISNHADNLVALIQQLATVPPKPHIRITGKQGESHIDFDVTLNIMNLIVPDDRKFRMNYVTTIAPGELGYRGETKETRGPTRSGLEEWAKAYCEDKASLKQFTLDRQITNWDTSYLEGRLLSLVNSTQYKGQVSVTFLVTHARVLVRAPDKVNRLFTNVTKIFTGVKKYEVVKSVWPYADVPRGQPGRKCAIQEEEMWFNEWKNAIRHAVLMRRKGWVTIEDRVEFLMEPQLVEQENAADFLMQTR
ncbi:hypothetical protein G7Y89_g6451 [Cudoniella acicularis]|uniref:Uncharacterized protein n=1 Tax=Cudoniella acicularis TaxID=354080 RepID=A0A8H4W4R6_9HELO|nr:hypothetical protein G7Y89_g6451 [Cudoniella acicularis]